MFGEIKYSYISKDLNMPLGPSGEIPIRVFRKSLRKLGVFLHNYLTGESFPNELWSSWGYSDEELAKNHWLQILHPDDAGRIKEAMRLVHEGKADLYDEIYRVRTKSGDYRWISSTGNFISRNEKGEGELYLGADRDITELKLTEERLSEALHLAQSRSCMIESLMEACAAVTSVLEYKDSIEMILKKSQQVIPYDCATVQLLQDNRLIVVGARGWENEESIIGLELPLSANFPNSKVIQERQGMIIHDFSNFDEPDIPIFNKNHCSWIGVPLVFNEKVLGLLSCNRMNSKHFDADHLEMTGVFGGFIAIALNNAQLHEEMKQLANTDSLTGLHTRRWFYESGQRLLNQSHRHHWPLAVIMMDLDDFKSINDVYGHQMGDDVLVEVSRIIKAVTRKSDLLCRYGGEEFSIILPETDLDVAKILAERILLSIESLKFEGLDRVVTISIGISVKIPGKKIVIDDLMSAADEALYLAKRRGKNRWASL
jgi:diguanylate cyclase (GGDEF)-like protein/PAS domain S-box-containing protein